MKFSASRDALLAALNKALQVTDQKSPHTAFKACMIETKGKEQIKVRASTEVMGVDTVISAVVKENGSFLANPQRLVELVSQMPKGDVSFSLVKDKVSVKATEHRRAYTVTVLDCEMRPIDESPTSTWTVEGAVLLRAWDLVKASVPPEEADYRTPPACQCTLTKQSLEFGSGCGRSLAKIIYRTAFSKPGNFVIPSRFFSALKLVVKDDDLLEGGCVLLSHDERRVYVESRDTLVSVSLPVQPLPAVDTVMQIFLDENEGLPNVTLRRQDLTEALRAMAVLKPEFGATLSFTGESSLSVSCSEQGETAEEELATLTSSGSSSATFSETTLHSVISPFDSDELRMFSNEARMALIFQAEQGEWKMNVVVMNLKKQ